MVSAGVRLGSESLRESRMREILTSGSRRGEAIVLRHDRSPTLPAFHFVFATRNIATPVEKVVISGISGAAVGGMAGNPLADEFRDANFGRHKFQTRPSLQAAIELSRSVVE